MLFGLPNGRLIICTGKGGTGKSVISCTTALRTADQGRDTLVISADPAHTLSDAFERPVADEPTKVTSKLWAVHVDSVREVQKNFSAIQEYIASVFSAKGLDEALAYEIALLPGITHLFSMLKVEEFMDKGEYDSVVLDTVASGEALRYLCFPRVFGTVSRKIMGLAGSVMGLAKLLQPFMGMPTPSKEVVKSELDLIERLEKFGEILKDPNIASLRLIANPDEFSIQNLKRSLLTANLYGLNVDLAIVNKVLPPEAEGTYLDKWRNLQKVHLEEVEASLRPLPVKKLRLFETELKGFEMLRTCGDLLFDGEDPRKVYYEGTPFKITHDESSVSLTVKVPFTEKEKCEVERIGDELILRVKTDVGDVQNVIPLPAMAYWMKLSRAKLQNGELHIGFEREHKLGRKKT